MSYNTNRSGRSFDLSTQKAVWRKGIVAPGFDPDVIRKDKCGKLMSWSAHGDTSSVLGWEIDHILPKSKGGSDDLTNLQPLQWENNRTKGDNFPVWSCAT
jgi:5-methylcytosine-specific restriction endonuclease McrA